MGEPSGTEMDSLENTSTCNCSGEVDNGNQEDAEIQNLGDPGHFIIVVLLFYSCWIVCFLLSSMGRHTTESEDYYSRYLEQVRLSERGRFRGRPAGRLALQALNNAVNVIQIEKNEKITYV